MKHCTKCNTEQPKTNFHAASRSRDGLQPWCKACRSAHSKATHDTEKQRAYRSANADLIREQKRKYIKENADKERERIRKWATKNPEKYAAIKRRHAEKHGDRDMQRLLLWASKNPTRHNLGRKELRDGYVAYVMTRRSKTLKPEDIPQPLIELKRQQLKLLRELERMKHENR